MAQAIGVISGVLGIFSFFQDQFSAGDSYNNKFRLSISNDGTGGLEGPENAGGAAPDVRIWSPVGDFLGITTNDNNYCQSGSIVCDFQVDNVERAPDYALFTANDDAVCITSMRSTYPNDAKYATVIGNWAEECSNNFGVSQATWYYSPDSFQTDQGTVNVRCAWIDANGDQPTTGIQVHWPDYDNNQNPIEGTDTGFFCNNQPTLFFHTEPEPSTVTYYTRKRNVFADHPSVATSSVLPNTIEERAQRQRDAPYKTKRSGSSHQFADRLVKSSLPGQSASYICLAKGAAGPSFVSYEERQFCHMPTKTLFPFCEDVALGLCWSDKLNIVTPKLVDLIVPAVNFTKIVEWVDFRKN